MILLSSTYALNSYRVIASLSGGMWLSGLCVVEHVLASSLLEFFFILLSS